MPLNPQLPPAAAPTAAPIAAPAVQPGTLPAAQPAAAQPRVQGRQITDMETQWPMFLVRKRLDPAGHVWAEIDNVKGLKDQTQWQKLMDELHRLEEVCWQEGFRGWLVAVPHGNDRLERWLPVIGAKLYHKDAQFNWYHKYVLAGADGKVARTIPLNTQAAVSAHQTHYKPAVPGQGM